MSVQNRTFACRFAGTGNSSGSRSTPNVGTAEIPAMTIAAGNSHVKALEMDRPPSISETDYSRPIEIGAYILGRGSITIVVALEGPRDVDSLRARLPLRLEWAGEPVWLVELDGMLLAHTEVCPHRPGPLPAAGCDEDRSETVRCPWHGYRFNARTGASCKGQKLAMKAAPRVVIENGEVRLLSESAATSP